MPDDANALILEDDFLVDNLLPTRRVHIIGGPSGSGKTTFIFQMSRALLDKACFLDEATHNGAGVLFISADRTRRTTHATLRRMGALDLVPRLKWLFTGELYLKEKAVLESILASYAKPGQAVIVEPITYFLRDEQGRSGDPNNYMHVSRFLEKINSVVERLNITVIASMHPSKSKVKEGYAAVREKILGSAAWGAFSDAIIFLEPTDPSDTTSPYRTLHVLPRNARATSADYMQAPPNGLVVPVSFVAAQSPMDLKLAELSTAETFTYSDAVAWARGAGKEVSTAERWLRQLKKDCKIRSVEKGVYKRVDPS